MKMKPVMIFVAGGIALVGCAPTVNVATPDPVKIDVNMRVDVYTKEVPKVSEDDANRAAQMKAAETRRARMGEIFKLKGDQVVGENRLGYLEIVKAPADAKYADYAKTVVTAENADRETLYNAKATEDKKALDLVQREAAEQWQERAFPKSWIQKTDGTWVLK
jgi:uncharacterized protein YdbL (DUF1318 family)